MSSLEDSLECDSANEICSGPITKREIIRRLKQENYLTDDLLEPLSKVMDTDLLDAKLKEFYDGIINDCGCCNEDNSQLNLTDLLGSVNSSSMEEQLKNQPSISLEDLMKEILTPQNECKYEEVIKITTVESVSENYINSEMTEDSWRSPIKQFDSKEMTESSWISPKKLELSYLKTEIKQEVELESFRTKLVESELSDSIIIINDEIDHISICSDSMQYSDISNDLVTSLENTSEQDSVRQNDTTYEEETSQHDQEQHEDLFQNDTRQLFEEVSQHEDKEQSAVASGHDLLQNEYTSQVFDASTSNSLESTNISSSLDDKSALNDTLEEMEMFMKYGVNYMNQKDGEHSTSKNSSIVNNTPHKFVACNKLTSIETNIIQSTPKTPSPDISAPFSDGSTSTPISNLKVTQKNTPLEVTPISYKATPFPDKGTPFSDKGTPTAERSASILKPHNFKVPTKAPLSTKKSPKFNNIVSPIAMYIKNSPNVPLVKNIVRKHTGFTPNVHSHKKVIATPQNDPQSGVKQMLPIRCYKPASRNLFVSKETEVALPGSIRKLIKGPLNPEIVKHMGRIKATPEQYRVASPNPIATSDMTFLSSSTASDGIFNVSSGPPGDISVLVSKSAARSNCLQGSQL